MRQDVAGSKGPTYDLKEIQRQIKAGCYAATHSAFEGAARLEFDRHDIESCVLALDQSCFYKTMDSMTKTGMMHDVYRPTYEGVPIYLKLQIDRNSKCVVISFKRDESR